jgi:hypothetical protein
MVKLKYHDRYEVQPVQIHSILAGLERAESPQEVGSGGSHGSPTIPNSVRICLSLVFPVRRSCS